MAQKIIQLKPQHRTFQLDRALADTTLRTVPISFSSENPVERWFGIEILDHSPYSVRLDRLKTGGPLLCDHDPECQIGVIDSVTIGPDRRGHAVVRFGKGQEASEIFQDVLDGIRQNVSVGYMIHKMALESNVEGIETYRATDWEPYEVSIVSIPADIKVGVGRDSEVGEVRDVTIEISDSEDELCHGCDDPTCSNCNPEQLNEDNNCQPPSKKGEKNMSLEIQEAVTAARQGELERVRAIQNIGDTHKCPELVRQFIDNGKGVDEFRAAILEKIGKAQPVAVSAEIGMSASEVKRYSIVNAIRQIAENGQLDGLEREASDAMAKIARRDAKGFYIPEDVMREKRAMSSSVSASGGFTIDSELRTGDMIELLRNKMLVSQLGARNLSGLVGNIAIPRVTGGATAYWLAETGTVTASDQAFGQLGLTPHRLVGDTAYSKELLIQSSIDVESFIREDLMTVLAIEKDRAAINGLGAAGEPLGILNTTGIGTVSFGAAATWAKVLDFETQVANANADTGRLAYLTTPSTRAKWKAAVKVTNQAVFLWENGNQVNGYPAAATKQVPSDKVIFGNWGDIILADWSGIDVVVDPYSLKKSGQVEITVTLWTDVGVRHPGSFCVSTDSGAQ